MINLKDKNAENKFFNNEEETNSVAGRNNKEYERIVDNAKVKTDDYWDSNSRILKIISWVLLGIIVIGCLYLVIRYKI